MSEALKETNQNKNCGGWECSRCGLALDDDSDCVDICAKYKNGSSLGLDVVVTLHGAGEGDPFATLCLRCLKDWLMENGMDDGTATKVIALFS